MKYTRWEGRSSETPSDESALKRVLLEVRDFKELKELNYGDYGLENIAVKILEILKLGKKIALYADYDVDGTMSCVSWIWFLKAIGYSNFIHYIPCRFREGYGVNLEAVKRLIDEEKVEVILTMDTGVTARKEAAYCDERGVTFICTDHHMIQEDKVPEKWVLNPKRHAEADYQELCGCGLTFVLLRRLGQDFALTRSLWDDLLALAGMATICDVVPLNPVNHRLVKLGISALLRSKRPVLQQLLKASSAMSSLDEKDVGYRLGPRINAVGRLEHADTVVSAFVKEDPKELIAFMQECNEKRKILQKSILKEAREQAQKYQDAPILFLGGDWHPGVVGIVASNLVEHYWKPVWLFQRGASLCKGSARSIPGFHITEAMQAVASHFNSFGGHEIAGGYVFNLDAEKYLHELLLDFAREKKAKEPRLWESVLTYDCTLPLPLLNLGLTDLLDSMKPFGPGFPEPKFCIQASIIRTEFYNDKQTGLPCHTAVTVKLENWVPQKIMFFNAVLPDFLKTSFARFIVTVNRNVYRGKDSLNLVGLDYQV